MAPPVKVTATRGKGKKQKEAAERKALLALEEESNSSVKGEGTPGDSSMIDPSIIRSGRACLACRKLKVSCTFSLRRDAVRVNNSPVVLPFSDAVRWRRESTL